MVVDPNNFGIFKIGRECKENKIGIESFEITLTHNFSQLLVAANGRIVQ